jgi:hypothetical protein
MLTWTSSGFNMRYLDPAHGRGILGLGVCSAGAGPVLGSICGGPFCPNEWAGVGRETVKMPAGEMIQTKRMRSPRDSLSLCGTKQRADKLALSPDRIVRRFSLTTGVRVAGAWCWSHPRMAKLYLRFPVRLYGIMLNYLSAERRVLLRGLARDCQDCAAKFCGWSVVLQ